MNIYFDFILKMDKNTTSIPKTLVSGFWDVKKQDLFADILESGDNRTGTKVKAINYNKNKWIYFNIKDKM